MLIFVCNQRCLVSVSLCSFYYYFFIIYYYVFYYLFVTFLYYYVFIYIIVNVCFIVFFFFHLHKPPTAPRGAVFPICMEECLHIMHVFQPICPWPSCVQPFPLVYSIALPLPMSHHVAPAMHKSFSHFLSCTYMPLLGLSS